MFYLHTSFEMGNKQNKFPLKRLNLLQLLNCVLSGVAITFQHHCATCASANLNCTQCKVFYSTPKSTLELKLYIFVSHVFLIVIMMLIWDQKCCRFHLFCMEKPPAGVKVSLHSPAVAVTVRLVDVEETVAESVWNHSGGLFKFNSATSAPLMHFTKIKTVSLPLLTHLPAEAEWGKWKTLWVTDRSALCTVTLK